MSACHIHADRPAVGLCVRCRQEICAHCCTRLDGINHCPACLRRLGTRGEGALDSSGLRLITALILWLGGVVALFGLGWLGQGLLSLVDR